MAGSAYAAAISRLEALAIAGAFVGDHVSKLREARDEAIRDALDEGLSVSRVAKALGISRQAADDVVRRVRNG